jgi:hypothetical protein
MAVLMTMEFDATTDQYDEADKAVDAKGNPPDGLIAHTAQDLGNGKIRIVDIWESPEAFGAFAETRLAEAVAQALGDDASPPPEPQFTELHNAYSV